MLELLGKFQMPNQMQLDVVLGLAFAILIANGEVFLWGIVFLFHTPVDGG